MQLQDYHHPFIQWHHKTEYEKTALAYTGPLASVIISKENSSNGHASPGTHSNLEVFKGMIIENHDAGVLIDHLANVDH